MAAFGAWKGEVCPTSQYGPPDGDRRLVDIDIDIVTDENDLCRFLVSQYDTGRINDRTPGDRSAIPLRTSLNISSSSAPMNAKDMTPIKHNDRIMAIPTMNMGPKGMMPLSPQSRLGCDGRASAGLISLGVRLWPRRIFPSFVLLDGACVDGARLVVEGLRSKPVVERNE